MKKKKHKVIKLKTSDVGKYCRVLFDDVGAQDGIITNVFNDGSFHYISFNDPEMGTQSNNAAPCIKLGGRIVAGHSDL